MHQNKPIIVPLDGSSVAERALPFAVALANLCNREMTLLRLVAHPLASKGHQKEALDDAERYLKGVMRDLTNPDLPGKLDPAKVKVIAVQRHKENDLIPLIQSLDPSYLVKGGLFQAFTSSTSSTG